MGDSFNTAFIELVKFVYKYHNKYGDFNGYKITFEAMEEKPANFLDCNTESDLLTLLGSPTLVTT